MQAAIVFIYLFIYRVPMSLFNNKKKKEGQTKIITTKKEKPINKGSNPESPIIKKDVPHQKEVGRRGKKREKKRTC